MPEGSLLALYTDGLIESRHRDVDTALKLLGSLLADASASLEATCDGLLSAMLPNRPADDVALLVARTQALDAGHVAKLDLLSDPAAVSGARALAAEQLVRWGLEELAFTTQLLVSELVTNAIRYASSPLQLRLILQPTTLQREVSDSSSTAPRLRRTRAYDEGGRGLRLVARNDGTLGLAIHAGREGHLDGTVPHRLVIAGPRPTRRLRMTPLRSGGGVGAVGVHGLLKKFDQRVERGGVVHRTGDDERAFEAGDRGDCPAARVRFRRAALNQEGGECVD
ncbi:SpoIIE family protein phosphatase [Streptomyces flaveolus]|uniref:SpoIIE family protein phosphatase n=1 Tax=Streptomyces flaveolus TaxID=67297 RepID=A0ABV3AQ62_9ACTN